ncbi:MAG: EAL domain-containing protein [Actinomycetia bacterium]|nr:EAL domain-containing protein [Actinomycetes bacterium]
MARIRRHKAGLTAFAVLLLCVLASGLVVLWRADAARGQRAESLASAEQYFVGVVDDIEQNVRSTGDRIVFAMRAVAGTDQVPVGDDELGAALLRYGAAEIPGFRGAATIVDGALAARSPSLDEPIAVLVAADVSVEPAPDDGATSADWTNVRASMLNDEGGADHIVITMTAQTGDVLAFVFEPSLFMVGASSAGDPIVSSMTMANAGRSSELAPGEITDFAQPMRSQANLLLGSAEQAQFAATRHITLFGEQWRLAVVSGEGFFRIPSSREVMAIAALGVVLSLAILMFTRRMLIGRASAEKEVETQTARFATGFEGSPIGVLEVDADLVVRAANAASLALFGHLDVDEVVGIEVLDRFAGESVEEAAFLLASSGFDEAHVVDLRLDTSNETETWVRLTSSHIVGQDERAGTLVQLVDVTEQRAARNELTHRALHDQLTQLPNRTLLTDRLERALVRSARTNGMTALMFIDVDLFKEINDTLGHSAGDRVLVVLAERMSGVLRLNDTIARFGGDEFVVLCEDVSNRHMASEIAERLRRSVAKPIPIEDSELTVTISTGLAIAEAGDDAEAVIRDADIAMYQAKSAGRGQVVPFEQRMRQELVTRLERERHLKNAIELAQLGLHYQPIVSLRPLVIHGFEALVRWNHPEFGTLQPIEFLGLAERLGMMPEIDTYVLKAATDQVASWSRLLERPISVAVNAGAPTISDPEYLSAVASAITVHGLVPGQLTVEVTEQHLVSAEEAKTVVPGLRDLGVKIAIDDFGTGHSSFAQVAAVAFDVLKIDRSLVVASGTPKGEKIMRAIVQMAQSLGVATVAEGVGERSELDRIVQFSPDYIQGHLLGRPTEPEDAMALLMKMERSSL